MNATATLNLTTLPTEQIGTDRISFVFYVLEDMGQGIYQREGAGRRMGNYKTEQSALIGLQFVLSEPSVETMVEVTPDFVGWGRVFQVADDRGNNRLYSVDFYYPVSPY